MEGLLSFTHSFNEPEFTVLSFTNNFKSFSLFTCSIKNVVVHVSNQWGLNFFILNNNIANGLYTKLFQSYEYSLSQHFISDNNIFCCHFHFFRHASYIFFKLQNYFLVFFVYTSRLSRIACQPLYCLSYLNLKILITPKTTIQPISITNFKWLSDAFITLLNKSLLT